MNSYGGQGAGMSGGQLGSIRSRVSGSCLGSRERLTGLVWDLSSSRYLPDLQGERPTRFKAEDVSSEPEVQTWGSSPSGWSARQA